VSGLGTIIVFLLRTYRKTYALGDSFLWILKIIPSFSLTNAIMFKASKEKLLLIRKGTAEDDFDIDNLSGDFISLILHSVVWIIVLAIIESGVFEF
jgi:hypothetical protein